MSHTMVDEDLIGLSFSRCIRDMAEGRVNPDRVKIIIAGTKFLTIESGIEVHSEVYWWDAKCTELAERFWDDGKIIQPRLLGHTGLYIGMGHWAKQCYTEDVSD